MRQEVFQLFDDIIVERRDRSAFAGDLGSDALKDLRFGARIDQQALLRLAKHVYEARRHDQSLRVDLAFRSRAIQPAYLDNSISAYCYIGVKPWIAGPVDDPSVRYDDVVFIGLSFENLRCSAGNKH